MEKRKNVNGSALIVVLIFVSFVIIVATTVLSSGTLLYELALDRVEQTRQHHAIQALMYYGIAYCQKLETEKIDPKTYEHSFDQWPVPNGTYQGRLAISPCSQGYAVKAILARHDEQLCEIQSEISHQKGLWGITSWQDS